MQTYNKIFRLLLNLRRIQLNLNGLWKNLAVLDKPVLELRWNLQHVLIHLSQYIQIDVIEVQKSIMDRQIDQCQDFDKFRTAHANFLVVIAAQTFLHVPAVIYIPFYLDVETLNNDSVLNFYRCKLASRILYI